MSKNQGKIISRWVYDPTRALFKGESKAKCHTVFCGLSDGCPLLDRGQCVMVNPMEDPCPYGDLTVRYGYTPRAQAFRSWIADRKAEIPEHSISLKTPPRKLAFIGDYVYLPYPHMTCKGGLKSPFLPREEWTLDEVKRIVDFRPCSLFFSDEIKGYQAKVIPAFLQHLREEDPEMWGELVKERPSLDSEPDYVGRKAFLRTLASPIEWEHNEIWWYWDGERLTTTSMRAFNWLVAHVQLESVEISGVPKDVAIEVRENSWVTADTQFLD